MTRPVVWSTDSRTDIRALVAFVSDTNPEYAGKLARLIRAAGESLGRYDTGRPSRVPGFREKSVADIGYILAYEVAPDPDGPITITRVLHASRDWQSGTWPQKSKPR